MKRAVFYSGVMALVGLAAGWAQAATYYCEYLDASEGTPNTTDPDATTEGCVWISSGGTISLMQQDINLQLIVKSPTEGWTPLIGYPLNGEEAGSPTTSTLLLSDNDPQLGGPSATGDISGEGDGILFDNNSSQYVVPGGASLGPYQFQVLAWTGAQYTSYAAAVGQPNTDTGRSAVFSENTCYINMLPLLNQGYLGNMSAIILQPQLPGDAVGDGRVDINDLTIVLTNFGKTGMAWNTGDFNGDGRVDVNDLTILLSNFGRSTGSSAGGMAAVPEPCALTLAGVLLAGLAVFARRFIIGDRRA